MKLSNVYFDVTITLEQNCRGSTLSEGLFKWTDFHDEAWGYKKEMRTEKHSHATVIEMKC